MAGPAASDVPDRYDVVFSLNDGTTYGFLFADSVESNLPFRTHKALYSYSPTFLERQNLSNTYGDNFQDFFLTGTQSDFSEGEQQKFFRVNDQDSVRKYWGGLNIEPTKVPGNVTLTYALASLASSVGSVAVASGISAGLADWYSADNTNLYAISISSGTITATSKGAHGAGNILSLCPDQSNVFIGGGTSLRRYSVANSTFNAFSATANVTSMVYVNNILYGYQGSTDSLLSFDSSGNATTQFQWKNADGTFLNGASAYVVKMIAYGGSIYILRGTGAKFQLWIYDGSGVRSLADLPSDFAAQSMDVCMGVVYISGNSLVKTSGYLPQVYYYVNGSLGKLWESQKAWPSGNSASDIPLCAFGNGVVFKDAGTNNIYQYDLSLGGTHCIGNFNNTNASLLVPSNMHSAFLLLYSGTLVVYGGNTNYNSTGNVQTSQYDFDNTLSKVFRGIKVDADLPANTSVDIAYQLDGAGGTYTNLQTGVTSGAEYLLPANTTGHSISVRVTLNSATGSATPTLKHVYVRAAPTLQQFRKREFLFDLSGGSRDELGKSSRRTRDLMAYPKDPITACNDLVKIATQTIPFTVYDRFTTSGMTVIADLQQNQAGYDGFAIYEVRPNVFIGRINLREV